MSPRKVFFEILTPKAIPKEILRQAYDAPFGGQFGWKETQDKKDRTSYFSNTQRNGSRKQR